MSGFYVKRKAYDMNTNPSQDGKSISELNKGQRICQAEN